MRFKLLIIFLILVSAGSLSRAGTKVTFRSDGIAMVNGRPFFPIGIWVYNLDGNVMADLHEHHFNTVIGNGFSPDQMKLIADNGMMAVPPCDKNFFPAAKSDPALLAWYLSDEPEGHNKTPEQLKAEFQQDKSADPDHPFGIDHFLWEALAKYKDCCDYTMTDVYPILAHRDGIIQNVGKFLDESRRIHEAGWPHWSFIQVFGGKDSDNGKWAQPLPFEVRCMTFIALAHRANAILYFSYWPKAPLTWASVATLNRDIERIEPWLVAAGNELPVIADAALDVRAKKVGDGYMVIAVNHTAKPCDTSIHITGLPDERFDLPYEVRRVSTTAGVLRDHFEPFAEHVYLVGDDPVEIRN